MLGGFSRLFGSRVSCDVTNPKQGTPILLWFLGTKVSDRPVSWLLSLSLSLSVALVPSPFDSASKNWHQQHVNVRAEAPNLNPLQANSDLVFSVRGFTP